MKKTALITLSIILVSCGSDKPDYILGKTASCSIQDGEAICKDSNGDLLSGRIIDYFDNGDIHSNIFVKKGKIDGVVKVYYENGKLNIVNNYKNGKLDGITNLYYENGKLKQVSNFKDGKEDGVLKVYYENGNLKAIQNYKNGLRDGSAEEYDEYGTLVLEGKFAKGKLISQKKTPKEKIQQACLERSNVCCRARTFFAGTYFNNEVLLSNGDCFRKKGCRVPFLEGTVSDIASEGVLVANNHMFIYTNKQYVNGQRVDPEHYYEYTGTYEYRTTTGGTNRVDAFKETNIPLCRE